MKCLLSILSEMFFLHIIQKQGQSCLDMFKVTLGISFFGTELDHTVVT